MPDERWFDIGPAEELKRKPVQEVMCGTTPVALTYRNGSFAAISGACNHVGGPLGEGTLDGEYVVCPWHYWKFHRQTGQGEPGYEQDQVPAYPIKEENGRLYIDLSAATKRKKQKHPPHPLARPIVRPPGPIRVVGISTTSMTQEHPRYSTSDALLEAALEHASAALRLETQYIKLRELNFRACEGFYSKSASACTWPRAISWCPRRSRPRTAWSPASPGNFPESSVRVLTSVSFSMGSRPGGRAGKGKLQIPISK